MRGRPRRTIEVRTVKLGADTITMLRRIARPVKLGTAPTLDDAVRQLAKLAGIPPETFGVPKGDGSTGAG